MLGENKNLKDLTNNSNLSLKDTHFPISYTKTHKLITALYMVTDIIEKEEPIRHKLRTLGADIITDMHSTPKNAHVKISEILSFLNIATMMKFISEMNYLILKKELTELKESIQEHINVKPSWIEEFLVDSPSPSTNFQKNYNHVLDNSRVQSIGHRYSNGHAPTRIGVQKGSTLMKALSDKFSNSDVGRSTVGGFDLLKKQRRDNIIKVIKENHGDASIKDIRTKINVGVDSSLVCSEKTLQRELLSMTRDGVLNKTGEKRWSRYSLK